MPPVPAWVEDGTVPKSLSDLSQDLQTASGRIALVYLSESCPSCTKLVGEVARLRPDMSSLVFIMREADGSLASLIDGLSGRLVVDRDGHLFGDANIYGTPTALVVRGSQIMAYEPGVTADWLVEQTIDQSHQREAR